MFTIINKHPRIQIFYNAIDAKVITEDVDSLRKTTYINEIQAGIQSRIERIVSLTPSDEIRNQINKYFWSGKYKILKSFLLNHPHVFHDLMRVIHKRRVNNNEAWWHIPDGFIQEIQQIFIFRERMADIWPKIPGFVEQVIENKSFISYASEQESLLDIGSFAFSRVTKKKRKKHIKKLVIKWLVANIPWCHEDNIDEYFLATKAELLVQLENIYGINLEAELSWTRTLDQFCTELDKLFDTGKWTIRKQAWKMIQSFHAWWDISLRLKRYAEIKSRIMTFPDALIWHGIEIDKASIVIEKDLNGVEKMTSKWIYKWYDIDVTWRIKTPKSSGKKSWEKEEYIHGSSIRDEIGLSYTFPDDLPEMIISEIALISSSLMASRWSILENKWAVNDLTTLTKLTSQMKKKPLFISSKPGKDPKFKNMNQSWFMNLWRWKDKYAVGIEIQYQSNSSKEWKEKDDPIYKLKWASDALIRWSDEWSIRDFFLMLRREIELADIPNLCDPETGESFWLMTYNDLLLLLIQKWILIAFRGISNDKEVWLLTTEKKLEIFKKKWNMWRVNYDAPDFKHLRKIITDFK